MPDENHFNSFSFNTEILDYLIEGFQVLDTNWKYTYVNNAAVQHAHLQHKSDLIGFSILEKFPGIENTELFKQMQYCVNEQKRVLMENLFVYPDGTSAYFELRMHPIPEGIFILSIDINDRKMAEIKVSKQNEDLINTLHMLSHDVRKPVTNILTACKIVGNINLESEECKNMFHQIDKSASLLDNYTGELTKFLHDVTKTKYV